MKLSKRSAKANDLNAINKLMMASKGYWGYDEEFMHRFIERFKITTEYLANSTLHLFYDQTENLIGFYSFINHGNGSVDLDNFFIHPKQIRQGYGQMMWQDCCNTMKQQSIDEFTLWSDPNSEGFYLKMGCERMELRESPIMQGRQIPIMKLRLNSKDLSD